MFAIPVSHQYCDILVSTSLIYKFQLEISTNHCAKFGGIFEETNFGFLPIYCDQCNKLTTSVEFMCLAAVNCDRPTPTIVVDQLAPVDLKTDREVYFY